MTKIITYSIEDKHGNSDGFYNEIDNLTYDLIKNIKDIFEKDLKLYIKFIEKYDIEELRYEEEYIFDFIITSILYKVYISRAVSLSEIGDRIIKIYNKCNKECILVKKIKGILFTMILTKDSVNDIELNLENLSKLKKYLEITNEFDEEYKRIDNVYNFLKNYEIESNYIELQKVTNKIIHIGNYFESESKVRLRKYTRNINSFLKNKQKKHRYKEDVLLTSRVEVEYHLNMVYLALISKLFRKEFIECKDKVLLLPTCLRFYDSYKCRAKKSKNLYKCRHCNKKCKVNELDKISDGLDLKTNMFSDESVGINKIYEYRLENKGVIVVVCAIKLLNLGLKLRRIDAKPQCLLLNFCGCNKHWDDYGLTTRFDIERIFNIIKM